MAGTRWRRIGLGVVVAIVALVAAALVWGYVAVRRTVWRPAGGAKVLAGLGAPARIALDDYDVPHVKAASVEDAVFLEGYVHAHERFFQMELARRGVAGRLAEMLGPAALPIDRQARRLGMAEAAARQAAALDGPSRSLLAAYARGVNAALAERGAAGLAPEFLVLGGEVEPWREEDTLRVGLGICFTLTNAAGDEEHRAEVLRALGRRRAVELWGWTAEQAQEWIPPDLPGASEAALAPSPTPPVGSVRTTGRSRRAARAPGSRSSPTIRTSP
jgi:penicillin amidase